MITLHIYFTVKEGQAEAFEALYRDAYVPAISVQAGFLGTQLLRAYESANRYEIDIHFENEALRARWAASPEHEAAWPQVVALCDDIAWQGYDIIA